MILDILRENEGAMTSRQIAEILLQKKGAELNDENIGKLQNSALNVLKRLEIKGLIMPGDKIDMARTWKVV